MNNDLTMIELPGFAMRALHSAWTDWLVAAPEPVRDAMVERCAGVTFQRFTLALMAQRLVVVNRLNDETGELSIGIAVPVVNAPPWELVWLPSSHTGMDWSLMLGLATQNFDEQISELLDSE